MFSTASRLTTSLTEHSPIDNPFPQSRRPSGRIVARLQSEPCCARGTVGPNPFLRRHLPLDRRLLLRHQLHPLPPDQALVVGGLLDHPGLRRVDRRADRCSRASSCHISTPSCNRSCHTNPHDVEYAFLFGVLWGIGGITFGLAIRYLGIALGYAIALGLCAFFGTLVPPVYHRRDRHALPPDLRPSSFCWACLSASIGVAVNGAAGYSKEQEMTPEGKA